MAINFEDSKEKYKEYIYTVKYFKELIIKYGYRVDTEDDIVLGATYRINYNNELIAKINWNVPCLIEFISYAKLTEESFYVDYVKNIKDWKEFFKDIEIALINFVNTNELK